jgi:hypothetical protein
VTVSGSRLTGSPAAVVIATPAAEIETISPFSIGMAVRVSARKAAIDEAR